MQSKIESCYLQPIRPYGMNGCYILNSQPASNLKLVIKLTNENKNFCLYILMSNFNSGHEKKIVQNIENGIMIHK